MSRIRLGALVVWSIAILSSTGLRAQDSARTYPSLRAVQVIMPFAAGGSSDLAGRVLTEMLARELKQAFPVVNTAGAGGSIGAAQVARAMPDGYTLLIGTPGSMVNNPNLQRDIAYDPLRDFAPICFAWTQPTVVLVHKDAPFRSLKDFVAEAKRSPGKINYSSGGVASFNHLGSELFASISGIRMTHIPYKGGAPATLDLIGRNVDVMFSTPNVLLSARDKLIGLAIAAASRSPFIPEVPTTAEVGYPGYIYGAWGGLFAPAKVSPAIIDRLNTAAARVLAQDSVKKRMAEIGVDAAYAPPDELGRYLANEFRQTRQLVESLGLEKQ